jgi:long-chain-fatty-acid--[acyl-carrier-protein] ligase
MLRLVRFLFWRLTRLVLGLRYRVRVQGRDKLGSLQRPVLVLPNHPAYIDPPLVISAIWPAVRPRPLIYEGFFFAPGYFSTPLSYPLIKLLDALLVPEREMPSAKSQAQARSVVTEVIAGLRRGEDFIFWPAGHIQRGGTEHLGAASALTDILTAVPEASVVLVRTRGVWGSMFSYARTGSRPNIMQRLWVGAAWLLSNLVFFAPRRHVDITLEILDRSQLPGLNLVNLEDEKSKRELRLKVNRWFEDWYNSPQPEKPESPSFVPYHFLFGPRSYDFPPPPTVAAGQLDRVQPDTRAEVAAILERKLKRELSADDLQPQRRLDELGLDSLETMDVVLDLEKRFGHFSEEPPKTVAELWLLGQGLVEPKPPTPAPAAWFQSRPPATPGIHGDTLAEAFVHRALAQPKAVAAADDQVGVLTYEQLLAGSLMLARRFADVPGPPVGLMLPASVSCDMAFLALQLAGKVPVMLNWTTGPKNLDHAVQITGIAHVITSNRFLDRIRVALKNVQYLCLEDVQKSIGRLEKLRTLLRVRWRPGLIRRQLPRMVPGAHAVILFTSGSEKAPKAVPLTHANLLHNQRASLGALELTSDDAVLSFLPAFHSFGLTVTSLLPLLAGLRVVHHPDPTAASTLVRKLGTYRPSVLVSTPTFLRAILDRAQPEQLQSLRLIYVGAEACPKNIWELCGHKVPGARLLEGYGATECAPVIAANRPTASKRDTVGRPLDGVQVQVVDPDTRQPVPTEQSGELLVSGPNVFPGYLSYPEKQPFLILQERSWYVTGDLAAIDGEGFITLRGRKSRFVKYGGEMISLPELESVFQSRYPAQDNKPRVAVDSIDTPDGPQIILFTTEPLTLRQANELLLEEGFHGVKRVHRVVQVETIPFQGVKVIYNELRARAESPREGPR